MRNNEKKELILFRVNSLSTICVPVLRGTTFNREDYLLRLDVKDPFFNL